MEFKDRCFADLSYEAYFDVRGWILEAGLSGGSLDFMAKNFETNFIGWDSLLDDFIVSLERYLRSWYLGVEK